jgi:hypothetical protein
VITFLGPKSVRAWLFGTPEGKAILSELRDEIRSEIEQETAWRYSVLVECRWDRVTVWADKEVGVSLCLRPMNKRRNEWDDDWTPEDDLEEDAIEKSFQESIVPQTYRYLLASKPRKTAMLDEIREFSDVLDSGLKLIALSDIRGEEWKLNARRLGMVK